MGRIWSALCAMFIVCLTVGCAHQAAPTGNREAPKPVQTQLDGTLISAKKVGDSVYSMMYWSRRTKVQAYVNLPTGTGPFDLVVYLHGGYSLPANTHDNNIYWTEQMASLATWSDAIALFPNYAGYGPSSGTVRSPHSDLIDTENAIKALRQMKDVNININNIYVFGASLGGDVAMMLAENNPSVKAVALDSPFPGAATFVDWYLKQGGSSLNQSYANGYINAYGRDTNSSVYKLNAFDYTNVHVPVLVIGGKSDPIIPPSLLKYMYSKLKPHDRSVKLDFMAGGHAPDNATEYDMVVNWFVQYGLPG